MSAGTAPEYAELVCLSNFSFQKGASHPFELVRRAHALGYTALAVTDECSLAGVVRAHETAQEVGLKLIIGSQFQIGTEGRLVLLAPDQAAYSQICALITRGRSTSKKGSYRLVRDDFHDVSHCIGLWLPGATVEDAAADWFAALPLARRAFGFTHLLAQDSQRRSDAVERLGRRTGIPVAAVGDVHYHHRERRPLHDVLTAVRLHVPVAEIGRAGLASGEYSLRARATLARLYPRAWLQNAVAIAEACRFSMKDLRYDYPRELVPEGLSPSQHLAQLTAAGAKRRWPQGTPEKAADLIQRELALIADLGYEHFFLTVEDIVRFARSRKILCQGRGSAANSAVCYALGVTEVDPERMSMLMERFISKERDEPPDIDVDFEHQRREEVIQYIFEKYGRARAAIAATVITYRRKSAVRDVGKALGLPVDMVDALSKALYWFDRNSALPESLARLGFDPASRVARQLVALVAELVGFPRHLSQHVGGFVISERPLHTLVPIEKAAMPDRTIIQWDKDDLEALGLLKVDVLALGMLSAIRRALEMLGHWRGTPVGMQDIPAEDPATYAMLCQADSIGVFQVESRAQMTMLPRLKPKCYYDLVIETAIIRPGPIQGGMVHPFLRRRMGTEAVTYPSPELEAVLGRTKGVPLFQEQVMQIAMVAAGFTAGEADQVRRSMAAWRRKGGLEHHRERLVAGMRARGYTDDFAESIYQQILGFSGYGFPESHAASFALLAYSSAWLKCHEPEAFLAGLLDSFPMGFYSRDTLSNDARRHGVRILPVDVRVSGWDCHLEAEAGTDRPAVRLGLGQVGGLVRAQADSLVEARARWAFTSVDDLAHRAHLHRRSLDLLARAGALAGLAGHRRAALWSSLGVERLPGMLAPHAAAESQLALLRAPSEGQEIVADYRALGMSLGRHPLELLRPRLKRLGVYPAARLLDVRDGRRVRVGGIVTHRQMPETASGVMFVSLEDETGIANLVVWKKVQETERLPLLASTLMVAEGECQNEAGIVHVVAHRIRDYSGWLGALRMESRDFH